MVVAPPGCEGLHHEPRAVQLLPSTAKQDHVLAIADEELPLLGLCHDLPPNDVQLRLRRQVELGRVEALPSLEVVGHPATTQIDLAVAARDVQVRRSVEGTYPWDRGDEGVRPERHQLWQQHTRDHRAQVGPRL